jgi:hypothetical protein
MVDEFKSLKDSFFKALIGSVAAEPEGGDDDELGSDDDEAGGRRGRALAAALFARAGKGKDEVVQIIAREIGVAVAAMLKEPLAKLAEHQKLQISFEFVPKKGEGRGAKAPEAEAPKRPAAAHRPPAKKPRPSKAAKKTP